MTHPKVELQGKCRQLCYDLDTGRVRGVMSGGGAIAELTGADWLIARYNDEEAPDFIGCIEVHYNPIGRGKALQVDLALVDALQECCAAFADIHNEMCRAEAHNRSLNAGQPRLEVPDCMPCFETYCSARDNCITFADLDVDGGDGSVAHGRIEKNRAGA